MGTSTSPTPPRMMQASTFAPPLILWVMLAERSSWVSTVSKWLSQLMMFDSTNVPSASFLILFKEAENGHLFNGHLYKDWSDALYVHVYEVWLLHYWLNKHYFGQFTFVQRFKLHIFMLCGINWASLTSLGQWEWTVVILMSMRKSNFNNALFSQCVHSHAKDNRRY